MESVESMESMESTTRVPGTYLKSRASDADRVPDLLLPENHGTSMRSIWSGNDRNIRNGRNSQYCQTHMTRTLIVVKKRTDSPAVLYCTTRTGCTQTPMYVSGRMIQPYGSPASTYLGHRLERRQRPLQSIFGSPDALVSYLHRVDPVLP